MSDLPEWVAAIPDADDRAAVEAVLRRPDSAWSHHNQIRTARSMKLTYDLRVTVDIVLEGGKPNSEALGDDVGDALKEAVELCALDGSTFHATKDDVEVSWTGEVINVDFGFD